MKEKLMRGTDIIAFLMAGLIPSVAWAASYFGNIRDLVLSFKNLLDLAFPVVAGLALLGFFWGLVKYIWGGAEDKEKGKNIMIYGVIALFVMFAIWGILRFIGAALLGNEGGGIGDPVPVPAFPR